MDKNKNEIRTVSGQLAIRETAQDEKGNACGESRTLTGRAIVFDSESEVLDDWGYRFREVIKPESCTQEFIDSQDIKMNLLHERNQTIARKCADGSGNMKVEVREDGVYFEIEVPKCDIGDRALELVRSGVYTGCSFEFYPDEYTIEENNREDGDVDCKITHTRLAAVTALTIGMDPAYSATSVNARELIKHEEKSEEVEDKREEEPAYVRQSRELALDIRKRQIEL